MRQKKGTSLLRRSAEEVKKYRVVKKIIPITMACIAVLVGIIYVVSVMYTKFGSFTVAVDKYNSLKYGISLSETRDFAKPTASLNTRCSEVITNIDGHELDNKALGGIDGSDNGPNYLCYTFYLKNTGQEKIVFDSSINIINMTMGIEKAIRVRLITTLNSGSPEQVDYARIGVDPTTGQPKAEDTPYETVPFYNKTVVMQRRFEDFAPDDVVKYTVVIWLEGTDPDCVDDIIGGEFKIDMKFSVISAGGIEVKQILKIKKYIIAYQR